MIERAGGKHLSIGKLLLIVAASVAVPSFAQTSASPPATAPPPAVSPVAVAPPVFEVSTVRENKSGSGSSESHFQNGRFSASNVSLKSLMQYQAYGIPERRILGGPKWLNSERFDIEAKTDTGVAERLRALGHEQQKVQTQAIFQQFLADRFKLTVHWETRELPIYSLVVTKKRLNLHPSKEPEDRTGITAGTGKFTAENVTLAELAQALTESQDLSRDLGRVVIDATGIKGRYDVALRWTPYTGATPVNSGTNGEMLPADSGPSIFTAIQEQVGLKLESTKRPVQVLVIDHVEMPSEN